MAIGIIQGESTKAGKRDNLFVWTVFLLLLAGLVFGCWLGSFYVFEHPENPRAYRLLKRLNKLPPPVRFALTKAPAGEFLEAQRAFERYSKFTGAQFAYENEMLLRNYLRNYAETKRLVPYLTGKYVILKAYELQKSDVFTSGVVVLTQSSAFPQILAEIICPAPAEHVGELLSLLKPGLEVRLQRTLDLSAIVQVNHAVDGRLQLTVVPLLYGNYALKNGVGSFSLEPPDTLNVAAGFPVVRGEEVRSVIREVTRHRNLASSNANANSSGAETSQVEIVRVDEFPAANGLTGAQVSSVQPVDASGAVPVPVTVGLREQRAQQDATADGAARTTSGEEVLPASAPKVQLVQKDQSGDSPKTEGTQASSKAKGGTPSKTDSKLSSTKLTPPPLTPNDSQTSAHPARQNGASATQPTAMNQLAVASPPAAAVAETVPVADSPEAIKMAFLATKSQSQAPLAQSAPPGGSSGNAVGNGGSSASGIASGKAAAKPMVVPATAPKNNSEASSSVASSLPAAVPLKPFLAAAPTPSVVQPTGSWKTFGSGKQPSGKSVTPEQATTLQGHNDNQPLYLHGKFVVTAAGSNRAVLRQSSTADGRPSARVIVEYPAGAIPPQQGAAIAREDGRGFEIREVRRSPDGQVNIYVREVFSR